MALLFSWDGFKLFREQERDVEFMIWRNGYFSDKKNKWWASCINIWFEDQPDDERWGWLKW